MPEKSCTTSSSAITANNPLIPVVSLMLSIFAPSFAALYLRRIAASRYGKCLEITAQSVLAESPH